MYTSATIVVTAVLAATGTVHAGQIVFEAFGNHLAGATLEIDWFDPATQQTATETGEIFAFGPDGAVAFVFAPGGQGVAHFEMIGDTYLDPWRLVNISNLWIARANFNLRTQPGDSFYSLFDAAEPNPGTPGSFIGRDLAYQPESTAPMQQSAMKWDLWEGKKGLKNAGDLFWQQEIIWGTQTPSHAFLPDQQFIWKDDTDIWLPAPGAIALLGFGAMVCRHRRR